MRQISPLQKKASKKQTTTLFSKKPGRHFVRGGTQGAVQHKAKQQARARSWQLISLWVLFLAVFVYQVFFSGILSIEHVVIEESLLLTRDEVEEATRSALSEKRWQFFPQHNFLLLSTDFMEERLFAFSPLIREVTVTKVFPNTVQVSFLERGNFLFWCLGEEPCFLIDEAGVLQDWPEAQKEDRVPRLFLVDETRKGAQAGDRVVSPQFLAFVSELPQAFLEQAGIRIRERLLLPSKHANELSLETDQGLVVRINTDMPVEQMLNTLRIVREKAIPEESRADLVSVDLRIPGKAFYQLRNQEPQESTANPETPPLSEAENESAQPKD
jgi:cell division septal protein FtsQ